MRISVVLAVLLAPALAIAQPGLTDPIAPQAPQPYAHPYAFDAPVIAPIKSPGTATALAIAGSLGGWALMAASDGNEGMVTAGALMTLVGPSAGHIYAGETGHAVITSLLRTAAVGAFIAGLATLMSAEGDCEFEDVCVDDDSDRRKGERLMLAGGIGFVALTIYDIVDAGPAARRTNERHARGFMVAPTMVQGPRGMAPAVALTGRF